MQLTPIWACRARWRRCSLISAGPVAQFSPMKSMPSGSSAVSAAPTSEPSSMVPVVSTVMCTISGRSTPAARMARLAPSTAALVCSRSWLVSTSTASMPPSTMAETWVAYASRRSAYGRWPSVGSLVPGPTLPRTQRGWSGVLYASADSRAIRAAASASSPIRSGMSYSFRADRLAPKVFVSTQSTPTSK